MKILYDHQMFTEQRYGGISRYFYELIRNMKSEADVQASLLLSDNYYISSTKEVPHIQFLPGKSFRGKIRLMTVVNKILSRFMLKRRTFDVFHPTYYDPYFLKNIGDKPFVLTVLDMIHEKMSDQIHGINQVSTNKKALVEKAAKIIAISENTKRDLIEIFGVEESKVEVVYLGNSMEGNSNANVEFPDKYILFVGSREGYKNFGTFISGVKDILLNHAELSLVCAGGGRFNDSELQLFCELGVQGRVVQRNLTDDALAQFYKNALVFVFPSLYEGFGIPVLEAFSCNCPLVCSNTSSLPEIAGDAAEYFDPKCEVSIANAVSKVLDSEELRDQLVLRGEEQLKKFSWKKTAEQTLKIYQSVVK